jgi:glycosyltransferase involved in cell wall biosynthesis
MMKQRILILGTYPLHPAMHGGQKRTVAIIEKYRELGHEVKYASICTPGNYTNYSKDDLRVSEETMQALNVIPSPTFTELVTCQEAAKDQRIIAKLKQTIASFKPTVVEYEQAYVYALVKAAGDALELEGVTIFFSSHNVEWQMKQDIALSEGCTPEEISPYVSAIKEIETELTLSAERVMAVSQSDIDTYRKLAKGGVYILAPNGINPLHPSEAAKAAWLKLFNEQGVNRTAVFVASAHPPNLHGFRTLIDGIGFLGFQERIVIAGGVSDMLKDLAKKTSDIQLATLRNRVLFVGRLSETKLQGLIAAADAVILPVLEGGGSNLKTAEAITSGKPIIATTHAFRSYDDFMSFPNTYIADEPVAFQAAIKKALSSKYVARDQEQTEKARQVLWDACLKPLEELF